MDSGDPCGIPWLRRTNEDHVAQYVRVPGRVMAVGSGCSGQPLQALRVALTLTADPALGERRPSPACTSRTWSGPPWRPPSRGAAARCVRRTVGVDSRRLEQLSAVRHGGRLTARRHAELAQDV